MYIIECKTSKPYDNYGEDKAGQESDKTLYKIFAIKKNLKALVIQSAIVTIMTKYSNLNTNLSLKQYNRAMKDLGKVKYLGLWITPMERK